MLATLPGPQAADLTGRAFFPHLISGPFHQGLTVVFGAAINGPRGGPGLVAARPAVLL